VRSVFVVAKALDARDWVDGLGTYDSMMNTMYISRKLCFLEQFEYVMGFDRYVAHELFHLCGLISPSASCLQKSLLHRVGRSIVELSQRLANS